MLDIGQNQYSLKYTIATLSRIPNLSSKNYFLKIQLFKILNRGIILKKVCFRALEKNHEDK